MRTIRRITNNGPAYLFAALVIMYSVGFPPLIMRNPCVVRGLKPSVYVLLPDRSEGCYMLNGGGWVELP
jgi:hypothetical protein